jgi:peptide chain release factor 1
MSFDPYADQLALLENQLAAAQSALADPELAELAQGEIDSLTAQKQQLETLSQEYQASLSGDDSSTTTELTTCIIEVRQGTGGDEAKIWANDLLRMYLRFCEQLKLKVEYLDEAVIKVKGKVVDSDQIAALTTFEEADVEAADPEDAALLTTAPPPALAEPPTYLTPYTIFKYESGVHRVQRVPATEAQGRIHTSTASVAVLPEVPPHSVEIRDDELEWQFTRSGGAGGQNVNKVNTAVRLTHVPSGITVSARQERTQAQNRDIALQLLRSQLWEVAEEKRLAALGEARSAIGRAQRAEKIRTYNFPQNRVTDHRIGVSWHNLPTILEGNLAPVVAALLRRIGF